MRLIGRGFGWRVYVDRVEILIEPWGMFMSPRAARELAAALIESAARADVASANISSAARRSWASRKAARA